MTPIVSVSESNLCMVLHGCVPSLLIVCSLSKSTLRSRTPDELIVILLGNAIGTI